MLNWIWWQKLLSNNKKWQHPFIHWIRYILKWHYTCLWTRTEAIFLSSGSVFQPLLLWKWKKLWKLSNVRFQISSSTFCAIIFDKMFPNFKCSTKCFQPLRFKSKQFSLEETFLKRLTLKLHLSINFIDKIAIALKPNQFFAVFTHTKAIIYSCNFRSWKINWKLLCSQLFSIRIQSGIMKVVRICGCAANRIWRRSNGN